MIVILRVSDGPTLPYEAIKERGFADIRPPRENYQREVFIADCRGLCAALGWCNLSRSLSVHRLPKD